MSCHNKEAADRILKKYLFSGYIYAIVRNNVTRNEERVLVDDFLEKYYFTFGSDEQFPYQNGWVEVHAENMQEACELFRQKYPDRIPGILNCSSVYTDKEWTDRKIQMPNYQLYDLIGI
jgi:hypothetical protein